MLVIKTPEPGCARRWSLCYRCHRIISFDWRQMVVGSNRIGRVLGCVHRGRDDPGRRADIVVTTEYKNR